MGEGFCYRSPLRRIHPGLKGLVALMAIGFVLVSTSTLTLAGIFVLMVMAQGIWGGVGLGAVFRSLCFHTISIAIGVLAVGLSLGGTEGIKVPLLGGIGLRSDALALIMIVGLRSLGCVSALYLLALTTPPTDIIWLLRRIGVPEIVIELVGLGYRYLYLFCKTAQGMHLAQKARLGYTNAVLSLHSLATVVSSLFIRSLYLSGQLYDAMVSRNYNGKIVVLEEAYTMTTPEIGRALALAALLVILFLVGG